MAKNPRLIDLSGQRFGKWLVHRQAGNAPRGGALWFCVCDCGIDRVVIGSDLRSGKSKSCGCTIDKDRLGNRNRTHGLSGTRLHHIWKNMRRRCGDPNNPDYGGRGVTVCQEWDEFPAFYEWAISNGYKPHLSIERVDVNGHYCPDNCTWAGPDVQSANRRFVKKAPDGELWWHKARANGITWAAYMWRQSQGWPMDEVVTWPLNKKRRKPQRDETGRFI